MNTATLDDVFADDISVPAADGHPLAATLFLARGARRHAVLINSATATPRKIYRGFARFLAHRGCAVLTYDYRGIGGSRAVGSDKQPRSLAGFKASISDTPSHSRGAIAPEPVRQRALEMQRAQGKPGAQHTRSLACK